MTPHDEPLTFPRLMRDLNAERQRRRAAGLSARITDVSVHLIDDAESGGRVLRFVFEIDDELVYFDTDENVHAILGAAAGARLH